MAYKYALLALAAPLAMAAPVAQPQQVVTVTKVVQAAAVAPAKTNSPAAPAAAAPSSAKASAAPSSTGSPTSGGSTSSGGKAGLVYSKDASLGAMATQIAQASGGKITWMYDWEGYSALGSTGNVEFVPQLHTPESMFVNAWTSGNPAPQGKGAKHALCVNEPDLNGWSASSVADLWRKTFAPHAQGAKLGSPATTGPAGIPWMTQFMKECSDCTIDFIAYHYYSETDDLQPMKDAIQKIYEAGGKRPVWITEFGLKAARDGGNFDATTRANFIKKASDWMDTVGYIERYSPYQVANSGSSDSIQPGNAIAKAYTS